MIHFVIKLKSSDGSSSQSFIEGHCSVTIFIKICIPSFDTLDTLACFESTLILDVNYESDRMNCKK